MTNHVFSRRGLLHGLILLIIVLILGCSGGGTSPITPDVDNLTATQSTGTTLQSNRMLWGLWNITIDSETGETDIVPLRGAEFTANITRFMQPPISVTNMISLALDPSSEPETGYFVVDVTLRHPFPGLNQYNGFDVRGILMSNAAITGMHDPTATRAGAPETHLLNPDGYTRWWNWQEFTSFESIFGATQGRLAPPFQATSTINGYKYYSDTLEAEDAVVDMDPATRGFFTTSLPGSNTRQFEIQFEMEDDQTVFSFNYAVDASWEQPDPSGAPDYAQDSYPFSANMQEPYLISITDAGTTAWYEDAASYGGDIVLDIEIFDWQGMNNNNVPAEVSGLFIEGDVLGGYVDILGSATVSAGGPASSVWQTSIAYEGGGSSGMQEVFLTAHSANPTTYEPQVAGGEFFDYPDAPLAAYQSFMVEIGDTSPFDPVTITSIDPSQGYPDCSPEHVLITGTNFVDGASVILKMDGQPDIYGDAVTVLNDTTLECDLDLLGAEIGFWDVIVELAPTNFDTLVDGFEVLGVIYVDGDNAGDPSMDGTEDHPYDTIQGGLDAAYASNDEPVIVDQAATDYTPFTLYNNSHVIGCNWNDGVGWPKVSQTGVYTYGNNVNNVIIDGLFFDITITAPHGSSTYHGMYFNQGSDITMTHCKFSGEITGGDGIFIRFYRSQNVEVEYCWFTELYNRASDTDWRTLMVIYFGGTDWVYFHHNEMHDIGYDIPDAGAFGTSTYCFRIGYDGQPPHNAHIHNNLIYNIFNKTDCIRPSPNPDPQNAMTVFSIGNLNSFDWVGDFYLYNNTVDDIRHADTPSTTTVQAGHVNAAYFGMIGGDDIVWKNNIASNIEPTDDSMWSGNSSYFGWWVDNYVSGVPGGQAMDYSLCFNLGKPLPPGANTYNWSSGFINQCHAGTGCYENYEDVDPQYDMTAGATFYHPTNTLISEGADDGSEMGAFGGPEGDWLPPSQQ